MAHRGEDRSERSSCGPAACQRATRVLRCAAALRVTHRPSLRSSSRYGPCGPAWTGPGRSAETLGAFFEQLGPGGCARIELVTADLASSWQKALRAWVPHARVVFDRFHVERLAADAVDEVRRSEQRRLDPEPEDAKALKGTRYALLKHPARLKPGEARRLETLRRENRALNRAYELKEYLGDDPGAGDARGCAGAAR